MTAKPITEAHGEWTLVKLPRPSVLKPWMVQGKVYPVVLRRWKTTQMPEVEVHDPKTGKVLATYSWGEAREMFDPAV